MVAQSILRKSTKIILWLNYISSASCSKIEDRYSENKTQYFSRMISSAELNFLLICL